MQRIQGIAAAGLALCACSAPQTGASPAAHGHDCPMHAEHHGEHHGDYHAQPGENPHKSHDAHHRFDNADEWAKVFESPERDAWQRGDAVVAALAPAKNARVADIGSGTGYFSVRLAKAAPEGKVFGLDIEADMVRYLNERAGREKLSNLKSLQAKPDDPSVPEPVDLVLVCDVYHHLSERVAWFKKLSAQLAPGARLAIVDFTMGDIPVGPPMEMRVAPEVMVAELQQAGFVLQLRDDKLLPYQHLLVFVLAK